MPRVSDVERVINEAGIDTILSGDGWNRPLGGVVSLYGRPAGGLTRLSWSDRSDIDWPKVEAGCVIASLDTKAPDRGTIVIGVGNPRLAFAIAASELFRTDDQRSFLWGHSVVQVHPSSFVHPSAVLGSDGFGHERHPDGSMVAFPHYGRVIIHEDVNIGAHTCVDRGALGSTEIHRGCRIDNLVHIAHNVRVGEHVSIAAGSVIGGSVTIEARAQIETSVTVFAGVTIGEEARIGSGATVTKNVPAGETWISPVAARKHERR